MNPKTTIKIDVLEELLKGIEIVRGKPIADAWRAKLKPLLKKLEKVS